MIFQNIKRTDFGSSQHSESSYSYLNRSARPEAETIRNVINKWFVKYPIKCKKDLKSRIKSDDDIQHTSGVFELYLHELFLRLGYFLEPHPKTAGKKKTKPDFLVSNDVGEKFYLEATIAKEFAQEDPANSRLNQLLDTINKIKSFNYFLNLDINGLPQTPVPGRKLKRQIESWLSALDVSELERQCSEKGYKDFPYFDFTHEGLFIRFKPSLRKKEKRNKPVKNIIGSYSNGGRFHNSSLPLRKAITAKGTKYGKLQYPLVIAVNALTLQLHRIDIMNTLYGEEQFVYRVGDSSGSHEMIRAKNGVWNGPTGIRYTRISGILIGFDIRPWTIGARELWLYINPWAAKTLNGKVNRVLSYAKPLMSKQKVEWNDGKHPREILKLPRGYPGK